MTDTERELWAKVAVLQAWVHDRSENDRRNKPLEANEAAKKITKIAKEHYRPREASGLPIPEAQKLDEESAQVAQQLLGGIIRST